MTIRLQKILLPTDFSRYSTTATIYACELAAKFNAELHLLHTLEHQISATPDFALGMIVPRYTNESKAAALKALGEILDSGWSSRLKVIQAVIEGSPKTEIVRYACANEIDLIILSTHGRTGLPHVMLGSVAENVVRTAPCPVLTVRPKGHQFVMP